MSTISYTIKTTPYEQKSAFGQVTIMDTRNETIEFDIAELTDEQRELFMNATKGFGANRQIIEYDLVGSTLNPARLSLVSKVYVSERQLALDEAFSVIAKLSADYQEKSAKYEAQQNELKAENERAYANRAAAAKLAAEREKEAWNKTLEGAKTVTFNERGKAICNLYEQVKIVSLADMDTRFSSNWVKRVTSVDIEKSDGYAFDGYWLNDQTIEIDNEPMVFIVCGTSGSRKHNSTEYRVVTLIDGKLERTDIGVNGVNGGWALRIRDQVASLLAGVGAVSEPSVDEFAELRKLVAESSDDTVTVSREALEKLLAHI